MALALAAEQRDVITILKIEAQYVIPTYQRPYSWEYDECLQLYEDIRDAYVANEDYFIGNIVVAKSNADKNRLEVIDGQQRLTTLLLLIKVLSLFVPEHNDQPGFSIPLPRLGLHGKLLPVRSYCFRYRRSVS